jgi:hypothetical protein
MTLLVPLPAGIPKAINALLEFVGTSPRRWNRKNGHAPPPGRTPGRSADSMELSGNLAG